MTTRRRWCDDSGAFGWVYYFQVEVRVILCVRVALVGCFSGFPSYGLFHHFSNRNLESLDVPPLWPNVVHLRSFIRTTHSPWFSRANVFGTLASTDICFQLSLLVIPQGEIFVLSLGPGSTCFLGFLYTRRYKSK